MFFGGLIGGLTVLLVTICFGGGRVGISYYKPKTLAQQNCLIFSFVLALLKRKLTNKATDAKRVLPIFFRAVSAFTKFVIKK